MNQWINLTNPYCKSIANKDVSWAPHTQNPKVLLLLSFYSTSKEVPSSFVPSIALLCFVNCKKLCYIFFFLLPWCLLIVLVCNSLIYCRKSEEFNDMFGCIDWFQYKCYNSPKPLHTLVVGPCYANDKENGVAWTKFIMIIHT
jgi:hypothetical protein